jgi:hypothetical protein
MHGPCLVPLQSRYGLLGPLLRLRPGKSRRLNASRLPFSSAGCYSQRLKGHPAAIQIHRGGLGFRQSLVPCNPPRKCVAFGRTGYGGIYIEFGRRSRAHCACRLPRSVAPSPIPIVRSHRRSIHDAHRRLSTIGVGANRVFASFALV